MIITYSWLQQKIHGLPHEYWEMARLGISVDACLLYPNY